MCNTKTFFLSFFWWYRGLNSALHLLHLSHTSYL
jgi:hypothetical protein